MCPVEVCWSHWHKMKMNKAERYKKLAKHIQEPIPPVCNVIKDGMTLLWLEMLPLHQGPGAFLCRILHVSTYSGSNNIFQRTPWRCGRFWSGSVQFLSYTYKNVAFMEESLEEGLSSLYSHHKFHHAKENRHSPNVFWKQVIWIDEI